MFGGRMTSSLDWLAENFEVLDEQLVHGPADLAGAPGDGNRARRRGLSRFASGPRRRLFLAAADDVPTSSAFTG